MKNNSVSPSVSYNSSLSPSTLTSKSKWIKKSIKCFKCNSIISRYYVLKIPAFYIGPSSDRYNVCNECY